MEKIEYKKSIYCNTLSHMPLGLHCPTSRWDSTSNVKIIAFFGTLGKTKKVMEQH
jgi:hypothetical protein